MKNLIFRLSQTVGLALFCIAALGGQPLQAQNTTGRVVATCGTVTGYPGAGGVGFLTVDTNGQLCSGATGGGGGSVTQGTSPWVSSIPSVTGSKAPGTAAASSALVGGIYNSSGVTLTDGQQAATQFDSAGNVKVSGVGLVDGATNSGTTGSKVDCLTTTSITGGTTATVNPLNCTPAGALRSDLSTLVGTAVDTNSGNKSAGTQRNVLATDQLALAAWGQGANGATAPTGSTQEGCRSASTAPTEVTDGQMTPIQCGLGGKQIVMPFTVKELAARGKGTATASTGATTIIAAGSGSNKTYVTDWECSNTSATNVTVTFNDSASTQIIVPATGGNNKGLQVPLVTAAATAFTFASDTSVTSVICNAQGYYAL